jgi:hypothetical protein
MWVEHEAGDAPGEIEACENAGPIDQGDGGENIEGVGHGREPIHFELTFAFSPLDVV